MTLSEAIACLNSGKAVQCKEYGIYHSVSFQPGKGNVQMVYDSKKGWFDNVYMFADAYENCQNQWQLLGN